MSRCAGVAVILALALPCLAAPVTVEVTPSADALVRSMDPDHNYGGGGALAVSGSIAVNKDGEQMGLVDSLIRFNLWDAAQVLDTSFGSGGWRITGASLTFNEDGEPKNPIYNRGVGQFEIRWIAADAWVEGTGEPRTPTTDGVTYNDLPSLLNPAADVSLGIFSNPGASGPVTFDLGLPLFFNDDMRAGGDVSLFLTATDGSAVGAKFDSRSNLPPELGITADVIPEPGVAVLLAMGMGTLAGRRIMRKK